jgi:hypothetical protein
MRLRKRHQYLPDRDYSVENHLIKIRILQSALSNAKASSWRLRGKELVEYPHEHYKPLKQSYGIPEGICSAAELYGRIHDGAQLERFRCVPVSHYYSMLMEDTPGFISNVSSDPTRKSSSRQQDGSRSRSRESAKQTPTSRRGSSYKDEIPRSVSERIPLNYTSTRRHEPRADVLSKDEKASISDLENKILLVRQRRAPQKYEVLRSNALNLAEEERKQGKSAPDYLEGVDPPWNDGRKEVHDLYDEMMVEDFKLRITSIRASSADKRAMEEAERAEKAKGGPWGQVRH